MKKRIEFLKMVGYFFLAILIYLILATTLSYFDIISYKAINIISYVFIISLFLTMGFLIARKSESKGYKSGLIMGIINISLLLLLSIILRTEMHPSILLYFLILTLSSTIGGMFGINFNKNIELK